MLCLYKSDISECIDVNKTSTSKEGIICHYWQFLDKGFKFQSSVSNGCHDVLIMTIGINSIVILNIHSVCYRCVLVIITKSEAINLLSNADLSEKSRSL